MNDDSRKTLPAAAHSRSGADGISNTRLSRGPGSSISRPPFFVGLSLTLLFATFTSLVVAEPAVAQERTHQISWGHPSPADVRRFVVLLSPVEGTVAATREIDVGLPAAQAVGGLSIFTAVVSFSPDEFLAVAAVGHDGQRSTPSNWSGMPPTRPGQPVPVEP